MKKYILICLGVVSAALLVGCGTTPPVQTPSSSTGNQTLTGALHSSGAASTTGVVKSTEPKPPVKQPTPAPEHKTVTVQNFQFTQATITIKAGGTVTWKNNDTVAHTVTALDGSFNGSLPVGASYSFTFVKVGTYSYICTLHPSMKGTVVVN